MKYREIKFDQKKPRVRTLSFDDLKRDNPMSNFYMIQAKDMYEDLTKYYNDIQQGVGNFKSYYQSILANCFEMYCKAVIDIKNNDNTHPYSISEDEFYDFQHHLPELVREIDNNKLISDRLSPSDRREFNDFRVELKNLEKDYVGAKYKYMVNENTFTKYYEFVSEYRAKIMVEIVKDRGNKLDTRNFIER